jgi:hypothetical protein
VLKDDIGEEYYSEKLSSVGERDTINALETVKSHILAQKESIIFFIVYVVLKTSVLHIKGIV